MSLACSCARKETPRFVLALCLLALCFQGASRPRVEASVADSLGLGSRAVSMGGALTALADDFSALYYNPAGLMYPRTLEARVPDRKGIRFDFGYVYGEPRLWIRASHDESEAAQDPFSLITPLAAGS